MKYWLMFIAAGLIWGSSFLLIKIGVRELDALSLVTGRLGIAALVFLAAMVLLRKRIPHDPRTLFHFVLVGFTNTALPFVLITWGEESIDSGLAGVLNSTTPLFTLVLAHLVVADDKINLNKLLGLFAGFAGVVLLATRSQITGTNPVEGQIAVLLAAAAYGFSAVYMRKFLRHVEPLVLAGMTQITGALIVVFATLFVARPTIGPLSTDVILAVITLAVLNTFIAQSLYYRVLRAWGASRATMVTYLPPPVSLLLGALFNAEPVDAKLILGALLIVGGVAVANWHHLRAAIRSARAPVEAVPAPAGDK